MTQATSGTRPVDEKTTFVMHPDYELNIGIEVHVQLTTQSKIFCSCSNEVSTQPNTNVCPICAGYPGVLPVFNKEVLNRAILTGLATNCSIAPLSSFARKHYFYPDLPKGYQITQSDKPICTEGYVPIRLEDGSTKNIRLIRIHIEEDAGKNTHPANSAESFVDLNRAGTPLLEIVSYPDITSVYEADMYLKTLRNIIQYLGVGSGNMEEGSFRADTNVSVRRKGEKKLGIRCELKNINSFKFIRDAIEYEVDRHIGILEEGGTVVQQTRLWNTTEKRSIAMRSKEDAADYRYFQDPDLPLIEVTDDIVERIRAFLPELPHEKFERLTKECGLSAYEADILVGDLAVAAYFDQARQHTNSKLLINWILRDVMGLLKEEKIAIAQCKVTPERLAELVNLLENGTINSRVAQEIFAHVAQTGDSPAQAVKDKGLEQIGSVEELEAIVQKIIAGHPAQVADYRSGKDKLFGFFVGTAMKETQGKADPKILQDLIKKHLA